MHHRKPKADHGAASTSSRVAGLEEASSTSRYRYSVARDTPSVLQISAIELLLSAWRRLAITILVSVFGFLGRPPIRPRARAAATDLAT